MLATLLAATKLDAVKAIRNIPMDVIQRAVIAGAVAAIPDETFYQYRDLLRRGILALDETDSGRAILKELGIDPPSSSDSH